MKDKEEKMVELSRFTQVSEAEMLVNLLKSEGIDCYARDGFMNQIYNGLDLGGVKVELLKKDLQRALEIMKDYGYSPSHENIDMQNSEDLSFSEESEIANVSEEDIEEYKRNKAKLSRTMIIGCIVIITALISLILLNKILTDNF